VIGDRWTANLIALAYHGIKRFDEFHRELPIATNVLSDRLKFLVGEDILVPVPYKERPLRVDYFLYEKGLALCSHPLEAEVRCDQCHHHVVAYRVHQDKVSEIKVLVSTDISHRRIGDMPT